MLGVQLLQAAGSGRDAGHGAEALAAGGQLLPLHVSTHDWSVATISRHSAVHQHPIFCNLSADLKVNGPLVAEMFNILGFHLDSAEDVAKCYTRCVYRYRVTYRYLRYLDNLDII